MVSHVDSFEKQMQRETWKWPIGGRTVRSMSMLVYLHHSYKKINKYMFIVVMHLASYLNKITSLQGWHATETEETNIFKKT